MRRLSEILAPEASQSVGDKSIVTFHIHQTVAVLKPLSVAPTDPISPERLERGSWLEIPSRG